MIEKWKEHFKNVMNRIRVGSIIKYKPDHLSDIISINSTTMTFRVKHIKKCNIKTHEACRFCVGKIYLTNSAIGGCLKKKGEWKTGIVSIDNSLIEKKVKEIKEVLE